MERHCNHHTILSFSMVYKYDTMATVLLTSVMKELDDAPMSPTQIDNIALVYDKGSP